MYRRLVLGGGGVVAAATAVAALGFPTAEGRRAHAETRSRWDTDTQLVAAPRAAQLAQLRRGGFDVLVIGGAQRAEAALRQWLLTACQVEPRALVQHWTPPRAA